MSEPATLSAALIVVRRTAMVETEADGNVIALDIYYGAANDPMRGLTAHV